MAIVQYGGGQQGGDYWSRFQPHDDASGVTMANGGFTGMGQTGLPRLTNPDGSPLATTGQGMDERTGMPTPQPGQWQTMGGQQPGAQGGDPQQQVMALIGGRPLTPQLLTEIKPQLAALGFKLQNDAPGRSDYRPRIQGADGSVFDLGDFGGQATWVPRGKQDWSSVGGVGAGSGGGMGQPGGQNGGILKALQDTPGYQFTVDQAMQGIARNQAGLGKYLTGGTLKALQDRAAGLASTRYDTQNNQYLDWSKLGLNAVQGNQ